MDISHHATLLRSSDVTSVDIAIKTSDFDVTDRYFEKFGVEDARDLVVTAHSRPTNHDKKVLVIRTNFITHESQNALLKLLEEPPSTTKIVFVVPSEFILLKTLQSRFSSEVVSDETVDEGAQEVFDAFLCAPIAERMTLIEKAAKKKDIKWQQSLKRGLIAHVKSSSHIPVSLQELEYLARTLLTRGASNKMLLEHLALTLPTRS